MVWNPYFITLTLYNQFPVGCDLDVIKSLFWSLMSDHPHIPPQHSNSFSETAEVDKINIIVKCAGKTTEVDMFPQESISVLLKEACDRAGKKPEKMSLVYEGK